MFSCGGKVPGKRRRPGYVSGRWSRASARSLNKMVYWRSALKVHRVSLVIITCSAKATLFVFNAYTGMRNKPTLLGSPPKTQHKSCQEDLVWAALWVLGAHWFIIAMRGIRDTSSVSEPVSFFKSVRRHFDKSAILWQPRQCSNKNEIIICNINQQNKLHPTSLLYPWATTHWRAGGGPVGSKLWERTWWWCWGGPDWSTWQIWKDMSPLKTGQWACSLNLEWWSPQHICKEGSGQLTAESIIWEPIHGFWNQDLHAQMHCTQWNSKQPRLFNIYLMYIYMYIYIYIYIFSCRLTPWWIMNWMEDY